MSKNKDLRTKLLGYHDLLESIPPQITHSWGVAYQLRIKMPSTTLYMQGVSAFGGSSHCQTWPRSDHFAAQQ